MIILGTPISDGTFILGIFFTILLFMGLIFTLVGYFSKNHQDHFDHPEMQQMAERHPSVFKTVGVIFFYLGLGFIGIGNILGYFLWQHLF